MARKITFTHPTTGEKFSRTTTAEYSHIAIKDGKSTWHKSRDAAERTRGSVYALPETSSSSSGLRSHAAPSGATCTVGPDATTGERCGKPAVSSWTSRSGTTYHECAEHKS
jgi:hypothetical protein